MTFNIQLLSSTSWIPTRATSGSAGYDLHSPAEVTISVGATVRIPAGIAMALPEHTVGLIYPRSSLGIKHGVVLANTVGVIDSDYRGEIILALTNHGHKPYTVRQGDRVAQLIITPYWTPQPQLVDSLDNTVRGTGGIGSTGQ